MLQLCFGLLEHLLDDIICPELFNVGSATVDDLRGVMKILNRFLLNDHFGILFPRQTGLPGTVDRHGKLRAAAWGFEGLSVRGGEYDVGRRRNLVGFERCGAKIFLEVSLNASQGLKSQLQQLVLVREIKNEILRITV